MKILILDIETAPNTAYIWGMFKENIPHQSRGTYETATCIYNRYQCSGCKKWFRSTKNIGAKVGEKFVGVNE